MRGILCTLAPSFLVVCLVASCLGDDCPVASKLTSVHPTDRNLQRRTHFVVASKLPVDAIVFWVNFQGEEESPVELPAMEDAELQTYMGHRFRVRTFDDLLVAEFVIAGGSVQVDPCGALIGQQYQLFSPGRDQEFEALTHDQHAPCVGPSSQWSCIRTLSEEEFRARRVGEFGFTADETTPSRVGLQIDPTYVNHIPAVPMLDKSGVGFLKMTQTKAMRDVLLPFYAGGEKFIEPHAIIPGNYTNIDIVGQDKIDLDKHQHIRLAVVKEMQQVLQWWTGMKLRHTSTFGIRIYRRGSMLIDHVDRKDTHLASAVVQVGQDTDEDGGWPLEVLLGNRTIGEVYLQPGEMVLYEGAWLRHGRPMRFKGKAFANLFTHFAPPSYKPAPSYPDPNAPLPDVFYGYNPQRCDTVADVPGAPSRCEVTEAMKRGYAERDEL